MIVVFGSVNVDLIYAAERLPRPGETVLARDLVVQPGGKGANQAVAAARDGASVALVGAIGRDPWAEIGLAGLRAAGVDLARLRVADGVSGTAAILTGPSGDNQIVVAPGANLMARAADVPDAWLTPETLVLTQMECALTETEALIARAAARGARVIHNLAPVGDIALEALRRLDTLVVNETEAAWLAARLGTGDDAFALSATLGIAVIRTLGPEGCEHARGGQCHHVAAPRITAIDTTAAGDCLTGVFASATARGLSPDRALARAVAAASLCCTRPGSQISLPDGAATDAFLASGAPVRGDQTR